MKIFLFLFCFLIINIAFGQRPNNNNQGKNSLKNTPGFSLHTPSCDELIHYRDVELLAEFDAVTKKYTNKYKIDHEAIQDAKRRKEELLNERGWDELMSTGTAISEGGVQIAQIAAVIKTYCDLIKGVSEMLIPVEGEVIGAAKTVKFTAEQIYLYIETGNNLKDISERNETKMMEVEVKYILSELNIAAKATKVALEFNKNITELIKIPEEREKLKNEVEWYLDMLDNAIAKYQKELKDTREALDQKTQIINGITKYLIKHHCKAKTSEEDTKSLAKKESNKMTPVIEQDKKTNKKPYYIFFTTQIYINDKLTDIISKPIPYNGDPTDISVEDKEDFIAQIKSRIPNQEDLKNPDLKSNINVHYGKPFSTQLLRSGNDAYEAIDAYKKSALEAVEGIGEINFLQLN